MQRTNIAFRIFGFILFAYVGGVAGFQLACGISSAQPMPGEPTRILGNSATEKPTIAVTTFENLSAFPENAWVAMSFSEALTVKLKKLYERFHVVERIRVYDVIRERGLEPDAIESVPPQQQRELGSLLGASYLIVGSVSLGGIADEPTTKLLANMRTVDVRTGEIKEATSVSGQMQEIFDLEIQLAFAFLKQVGVDITAAEGQQISIKETSSLLAEKYYNLGNQHFYDGNLEAAEVWYAKAVELLEGGYYREAALRRVEVLRQQKAAAKTEAEKQRVIGKMRKRIDQINQRRAEADEMLFEQAELLTEVGQYENAIEAYQLYLEKVKPWQQVRWKTAVDDVGDMVISEKNLYILGDGKVTALEKDSGTLKWTFRTTLHKHPQNIITFGNFVCFQEGEILYALDGETGEQRWKFETSQKEQLQTWYSSAALKVADGSVYVRPGNGVLYALAGDTGQLKWQFNTIPGARAFDPILGWVIFSVGLKFQTDLDNGNVPEDLRRAFENHGFEFPQNAMVSIKAEDGNWRMNMTPARYTINIKKEGDKLNIYLYPFFLPPPVISDGVVYINKYDNSFFTLAALNAETGAVLWNAETPIIFDESPIVTSETIYVPTHFGVVALQAETGRPKWQSDSFENPALLKSEGDLLYVLSDKNCLIALSVTTGKVRWKKSFEHLTYTEGDTTVRRLIGRRIILVNGILLYRLRDYYIRAGGRSGSSGNRDKLCALSAETGEMLWEFEEEEIGAPIIHDGIVCFDSKKDFYAVVIDTGEIQWKATDIGITTHPWRIKYMVRDSIVYFGYYDKSLYAVAVETGEIQWEVSDLGKSRNYAVAADGTVYIMAFGTDGYRVVFAFSPKPAGYRSRPEETDVLLALERAKRLMGRYDDAIAGLQKMLSSRVDFPHAYPELALCYEGMGNWSEATRTWDGYLALSAKLGVPIPEEATRHLWELAGVRWHGPGASLVPGGPIIMDDTIYLSAEDYVYALNTKTGMVKWRFWGGSNGIARADDRIIVFSVIYSPASVDFVHALDAKNGEVQWEFQIVEGPSLSNLGPPVVTDEVVYVPHGIVGSQSSPIGAPIRTERYIKGRLYALSTWTGELLWKFELPPPKSKRGGQSGIHPSYLVVQDKVYWSPDMHHLYAISKESGELKWQFNRGEYRSNASAPVVTEDMVYVTVEDGLSAINTEMGKIAWSTQIHSLRPRSPLIVSGERIYVASYPRSVIYSLTTDTGEIKWQSKKNATVLRLIVDGGIIYSYYAGGAVSALVADTGEVKWTCHGESSTRFILEDTPAITLTDQDIYIEKYWFNKQVNEIIELVARKKGGRIVYTLPPGGGRTVYAISRENGKLRWKFDFAHHPLFDLIRSFTIDHETLYVSSFTGLYAFDFAKINQLLAKGKRWWK